MNPDLSPAALARLNDKKWRRSQSKWMLWIYLTSSSLGVIGFARIAIKTKNKTALKYTYILSGILFVLFVLISLDNPTEKVVDGETVSESGVLGTIGGLLILVNYGLQIFLSFKVNKIWLVFKAQDNNPNWVQENLTVRDMSQTGVEASNALIKDELGIDQNDYVTSTPDSSFKMPPPPPSRKTPPPPPVSSAQSEIPVKSKLNLNKATVEDLMKVVGIDPVLAANIVVQREKVGGFSSFESFATTMQLQPHQIAKLKPTLIVEKVDAQQSEKPGRVLDI
jgi:DNA uptake protein ComE-like DNA-binding protein